MRLIKLALKLALNKCRSIAAARPEMPRRPPTPYPCASSDAKGSDAEKRLQSSCGVPSV